MSNIELSKEKGRKGEKERRNGNNKARQTLEAN